MKPRTDLLLCSGFFFLGGLLLYPIVQYVDLASGERDTVILNKHQ